MIWYVFGDEEAIRALFPLEEINDEVSLVSLYIGEEAAQSLDPSAAAPSTGALPVDTSGPGITAVSGRRSRAKYGQPGMLRFMLEETGTLAPLLLLPGQVTGAMSYAVTRLKGILLANNKDPEIATLNKDLQVICGAGAERPVVTTPVNDSQKLKIIGLVEELKRASEYREAMDEVSTKGRTWGRFKGWAETTT